MKERDIRVKKKQIASNRLAFGNHRLAMKELESKLIDLCCELKELEKKE